jgi:hypothetical protein
LGPEGRARYLKGDACPRQSSLTKCDRACLTVISRSCRKPVSRYSQRTRRTTRGHAAACFHFSGPWPPRSRLRGHKDHAPGANSRRQSLHPPSQSRSQSQSQSPTGTQSPPPRQHCSLARRLPRSISRCAHDLMPQGLPTLYPSVRTFDIMQQPPQVSRSPRWCRPLLCAVADCTAL